MTPTKRPNFSSKEGGSWRDSMCLAKAGAAAFSLVTTLTLSAGSMTSNPAIIAAAARFSQPKEDGQCSSPPLRYPAWVLSSPCYDPFMTAFVAYCPACLPVLSSSLFFLPASSLPLSYPASIFIGSSPGFLVFREVPTLLNFINLFPTSLPVDFNPLTHWRLLSPC